MNVYPQPRQARVGYPRIGGLVTLGSGRRGPLLMVPSLVVAAALLAPLAALVWNGLSPVGMTEESTGYRYFYSLRVLYTPDERPWLPQGQVMTIGHLVLQWLLTAAGFPVTQLTPRMEVFAYISAGVTHLATAVTLGWAVLPLRSVLGRLAVVAGLIWAAYDRALSYGYHLVLPDYHPWIHVVAMVSLGCCLRLTAENARPSMSWTLALGLFSGLALALKVTMAVFVIPPALLLLLRWRSPLRVALAAACIGFLTGAVFLEITWLSYGGSAEATVRFLRLLIRFSETLDGPGAHGPLDWYLGRLLTDVSWPVRVSAATPIVLALSALALRPRLLPLLFLPSALLSMEVLWKRDESTTLVEVFDYALIALTIWVVRVGGPALGRSGRARALRFGLPRPAGADGNVTRVAAAVALVVVIGAVVLQAVPVLMAGFIEVNPIQVALDRFTSDPPGRTAIVTLGNDHRPLTRDSAIYKGGTNHGESNQWGASPFVQALVPDRHYFFASGGLGPPIDVSSFRYLLFVSREPPERLDVTEAKLVEQFGLSLIGFECPLQLPIPGSIHYGCRRRPDAPIEERQGTVGYAWAPTVLAARGPVALAGEGRRRPQVGEATYTDATGEIWRLDPDGSFTRLHGSPGQRVRIDALGSWQKGWDGVAGLDAIFDGTHWEVGDSPRRPINRNPTLRRQPDSSIRGWEVLMREAVTVDRRPGAGDPQAPEGWLELAARRSYGRVGVRSGLDVDDYPGAPLTVVAVARAFASAPITVRIGAAAPQNTVTVVGSAGDDARTVPSSGEWTTLMVRVEPDQIVGERVAVIVELVDPKVGDRLDVSRVEIYAGRYPGP